MAREVAVNGNWSSNAQTALLMFPIGTDGRKEARPTILSTTAAPSHPREILERCYLLRHRCQIPLGCRPAPVSPALAQRYRRRYQGTWLLPANSFPELAASAAALDQKPASAVRQAGRTSFRAHGHILILQCPALGSPIAPVP